MDDVKKQKRKEYNRLSAQKVRARKKEQLLELEKENRELRIEVEKLRTANRKLWSRRVIGPDDPTESFSDTDIDQDEKEMAALGIFIDVYQQVGDNK